MKKTDYDKNTTFQEVIVVEGMHDLSLIKEVYPKADVIITNGSEISLETLNELKNLNEKRGLILFMDPDVQGERIRREINNVVGATKHAFVKKQDAISKNRKKIGVEHVDKYKVKEALDQTLSMKQDNQTDVLLSDLYEFGLIGQKYSRILRQKLGEQLGIGLNNGKTFYKKIVMFGITKEQILKILRM